MDTESKREREKRVVSEMIGLYCRRNHHTKQGQLFAQCEELSTYARGRSDYCPFMEKKPFAQIAKYTATSLKCAKRSAPSCDFPGSG